MKGNKCRRRAALLLAVITALSFSAAFACARVVASAGGVFIVENDDELDGPEMNPVRTTAPVTEAPTTAAPAATTRSDTQDAIGRVFNALDDGLNRLISGLGGETTTLAPASAAAGTTAPVYTAPATAPTPATAAPAMNAGNLTANFTMPVPTTAAPAGTTAPLVPYGYPAEPTAAVQQGDGVLRYTIDGATQKADDSALSGSTLTIIVFVAAVLILILVIILALVIMTRRNEFNSKVMNRSTLPNVEKPDNQIFPDGGGQGGDLTDIRGWEDPS